MKRKWERASIGIRILLILALLSTTITAFAAPADTGRAFYIEGISYGGSGCPEGTVGQSISDDRTVATLIFDSYVASTGPGVPIQESRKACQININLRLPNGWSCGSVTTTYRGYLQLAAGQIGSQNATYYFAGGQIQQSEDGIYRGPMARDYTRQDVTGFAQQVTGPPGTVVPLNIKSAVAITGPSNAQGQMTTDSIDFKVELVQGSACRGKGNQ